MEDLYFNLEELDNMSRSEIQALCKKFGIRANIKTDKMKEKLRQYHEDHLNSAKDLSREEEKSEVEEGSLIEPSSVSESVAESAAESEVETMDIVPEHQEESVVEERKEETRVVEEEPASEVEEQKSERSEAESSKMEVESTVTDTPIETKQVLVPKIDFPPYEVKTDADATVFIPYSELQPAAKAPMTPRTKKRVDGIRKNREDRSKNKKIAVLDEKRKHLAMVVDKISVMKRTTKPTELPKIDDSIDTPKKKASLTWSEIEASAEANGIPLNQEDIDKFLERKKDRIQHQMLLSKGPSMLQRTKPMPESFDEFVSHLVKPKEEEIVRLAPGQTGFEFNPKVEKVVPSTPGTTRGVQSKFGFSAVKTSFTSAASAAVNSAKVANTAKPAVKTQSKTGVTKTTAARPSTASNGDYVLGTKNLNNLKEAGSATQAKPRASIATAATTRVASTVTKPVVAQSKIDSRRSLLPSSAATSAAKTVTKPVASRPSMVTKPVARQSLVPSRPSMVTKPTTAASKTTASGLPAKSNIVKPITSASLKQAAAAKAAENKPADTEAKTESTSESKVVEAPKVATKTDAAPKVAATITKTAPRQSLVPKPSIVTKTAPSTSVTKPSTAATKPVITKPAPTTAAKAPLAASKPVTTKPSIATLIKKRKLDDASSSGPAAKKQKTTANNENIENMQNIAVSAPIGVSF